jgi:hypothetical protein
MCYKLVYIHKQTPNIQEVMTFPNWLSVKQNLQKLLWNLLYRPIWILETNTFLAQIFLQIFTLVDHVIRNNFSFESVA